MQKQNVSVACEWWIKPHSSLSHTLFPVVVIYTWLLFSYRLHTNNNNSVRSQFNNFMCRGGVINQCSSGVSTSPTATPPTTPRHSKSKQAKTEIEKLTTKWKHSLIQKKKKNPHKTIAAVVFSFFKTGLFAIKCGFSPWVRALTFWISLSNQHQYKSRIRTCGGQILLAVFVDF